MKLFTIFLLSLSDKYAPVVGKNQSRKNATTTLNKSIRKKKTSRKKETDKKPVSAYALFFSAKQVEIKKLRPDASFGEVSKIVASEWEALPVEAKAIYKKTADQEKKKYLEFVAASKAHAVAGNSNEFVSESPYIMARKSSDEINYWINTNHWNLNGKTNEPSTSNINANASATETNANAFYSNQNFSTNNGEIF